MIESEHDAITGGWRFILRPNASLSERQARLFLAAAAGVMGGIAAGFAGLGLWMVLPFSGAEWLLLAICLKASFRAGSLQEVIHIDDRSVVVERGHGRPEHTHRFQRAWIALEMAPSPIPGHPSRLFLRLHGQRVEVGRFLAESERDALARELRQVLAGERF
jgi:uncharacterized membrane protein